jgi:hypothetical protein
MVTIIIRNDRFRIFMTDNINEQPIEFVSNSESKYVMGFTSRNSRRVRIWKTGRNIPTIKWQASQITDDNVVFDAPYNNTCIIDRRE